MPDLDRFLYDHLRAASARVDLPAGDAGAVMARGRVRRRRRRGAAALVAVAAVGSVTGALLDRAQPHHVTNVSTGLPAASPPASDRLALRVVPLHSGLSYVTSLSSSGGGVEYAVSTAPGTVGGLGPGVLYRSSDGLTWTVVNDSQGLSLGDIAVTGNRVYSVGTGTATAAVGSPIFAAIQSGTTTGTTWQKAVLPLDLGSPPGLSVIDEVVKVGAGPTGVLAVVGVNATINLHPLLPAGVAAGPWAATAQGVELLGVEHPSPCGPGQSADPPVSKGGPIPKGGKVVTPTTSASSQTSSASEQVTGVSCYGTDKSSPTYRTLSPETAYPVLGTYTWSQLHVTPDLAAALQGRPVAFFASDGKHFAPVSLPAGVLSSQMSISAGPTGFVLVGTASGTANGLAAVQSDDGKDWTAAPPLPGAADSIIGAGLVGGHVVVIAGTNQSGSQAFTLNGNGWTVAQVPGSVSAVGFGPLGVAAVATTGQSKSSNTWQVLFSRNGTAWSAASLTALVGDAINPANVSVGASQVVVTVTQAPRQPAIPATPATQVAVVGTVSSR
jgi:hypothetical protein